MSFGEPQGESLLDGNTNPGFANGEIHNGLSVSSNQEKGHQGISLFRMGKLAKLAKQDVVEEEETERSDRIGEAVKEVKEGIQPELSRIKTIDVTQRKKELTLPNLDRPVSLMASKPKLLVRSHALCGDDDTRLAVRYASAPRLTATTRSSTSSLSVESCHDLYTDATGIDLQSFIVSTLHKNMKDRQMLLQLEQHMLRLINDSGRHSLKFPPMSSYNRMLVHRVAAFFGLDHNVDQSGTAVVVNKTAQTRIPDIEFASLIQSDMFTDEPRRYLRRDAQSFEEGRHCLGADLVAGRRAHSFEAGEYCRGSSIRTGCQLSVGHMGMHVVPQQDSASSTDASSTHHLLESPGSCYSYGEVPYMGIYQSSDGNGHYGGAAAPQLYPWSSSESYTSYSSSVELPQHVMSPAVHSPSRPPLLTKCASVDTSGIYKSASLQLGVMDQRQPGARRSLTERHRGEILSAREPSIPEHVTVPNSTADESEVGVTPVQQPLYYEVSGPEQYAPTQYIVGPVQGQPYTVVSPYVQYVSPNAMNSCRNVQGLTQQMEGLCVTDSAETVSPQFCAYQMSTAQGPQTAIPQVSPSPVGTLYPNQTYYLPVLPQGYVFSGAPPPSIYRISPMQMPRPNFDYSPASSDNVGDGESGPAITQMSNGTEQY